MATAKVPGYDDESAPQEGPRYTGPKFQAWTAAQLMKRKARPLEWLVPNIFPKYCFLAAANAKAGKTRLFTTAALKIITTQPEVGKPPKFLYLCPDATDADQWSRDLNEIAGGVPGDYSRLIIDPNCPGLDDGLVAYVEDWLDAEPEIVGVVVDVYNSVKASRRKSDDIQKDDHSTMRSLAQIAERRKIGMAILTHTNVHGKIAGSMGLRGGVHALMMLDRIEKTSHVDFWLTGRGIPKDVLFGFELNELSIEWEPTLLSDDESEKYTLEHERQLAEDERRQVAIRNLPHKPGPIETLMREVMADMKPWAPLAIAKAANIRPGTAREYCRRMASRGDATLVCGGMYQLAVSIVSIVSQPNGDTAQAGNEAPGNNGSDEEYRSPETQKTQKTQVKDTHTITGSKECVGHCLRYVAPEKGEACDRCGHCRWRVLDDLYICQKCHPNWMDFVGRSEEGGIK